MPRRQARGAGTGQATLVRLRTSVQVGGARLQRGPVIRHSYPARAQLALPALG